MSTDSRGPSPEHTSGAAAPEARHPRPRRVALAAALVGLEGLVVAAGGAGMLVLLAFGDRPDSMTQAVAGAVTVLLLAVLPLVTARGLWRSRRWSRSPAVLVQLLALPVGWQMGSSQGWWVAAGLTLAAVAVTVLVCLFHPRTHAALDVGRPEAARPATGRPGADDA